MVTSRKRRICALLSITGIISLSACSNTLDVTQQEQQTTIVAENNQREDSTGEVFYGNNTATVGQYDINLNQAGYRPEDTKIAVIRDNSGESTYNVLNEDGAVVMTGMLQGGTTDSYYNETLYYADFSDLTEEGTYYLVCGEETRSPFFEIRSTIYTDFLERILQSFMPDLVFSNRVLNSSYSDEDSEEQISDFDLRAEDAILYRTQTQIDVSGGWTTQDAIANYVVPSCVALANMMYATENYEENIIEQSDVKEDQEVDFDSTIKTEIQWLFKMQDSATGGVFHKASVKQELLDGKEDADASIYVCDPSTSATADFAAVMAKASKLYEKTDTTLAIKCLAASKKAWNYIKEQENTPFTNPDGIATTEYSDQNDEDERLWAATELYLATGEEEYYNVMTEYFETELTIDFGWQDVAGFAYIDYYFEAEEQDDSVMISVKDRLNEELERIQKDSDEGYFINKDYSKQTSSFLLNRILFLSLMETGTKTEYSENKRSYLNYILGQNPNSKEAFESLLKDHEIIEWDQMSALLVIFATI